MLDMFRATDHLWFSRRVPWCAFVGLSFVWCGLLFCRATWIAGVVAHGYRCGGWLISVLPGVVLVLGVLLCCCPRREVQGDSEMSVKSSLNTASSAKPGDYKVYA